MMAVAEDVKTGISKEEAQKIIDYCNEKSDNQGKKIKSLVVRVDNQKEEIRYIKIKWIMDNGRVNKKVFYSEKIGYQQIMDWINEA